MMHIGCVSLKNGGYVPKTKRSKDIPLKAIFTYLLKEAESGEGPEYIEVDILNTLLSTQRCCGITPNTLVSCCQSLPASPQVDFIQICNKESDMSVKVKFEPKNRQKVVGWLIYHKYLLEELQGYTFCSRLKYDQCYKKKMRAQ